MLRRHVSALFRNGGNKSVRNKRFDIPVLFNSAVMALVFNVILFIIYLIIYKNY